MSSLKKPERQWQSLRQYEAWQGGVEPNAETQAEMEKFAQAEFPQAASLWNTPWERREFLRVMAGSLALAGMTACTRHPLGRIVPYVRAPEALQAGESAFFATSFELGGVAFGALVESHEGRPTKVEGNPEHPTTLGASDAWMQAQILSLYDPDRSQTVRQGKITSTWSAFDSALGRRLQAHAKEQGEGLRILAGATSSPLLRAQLAEFKVRYPRADFHFWEPLNRDAIGEGTEIAFGKRLDPRYDLSKADLIVALDHDFFMTDPGRLAYARQFSRRRRVRTHNGQMEGSKNRLYAVEPSPTLTGAVADGRLSVRACDIEKFARGLFSAIIEGKPAEGTEQAWVARIARELQGARGRSVLAAGEGQPPVVHAIVHFLNSHLGNVGETVGYLAADPSYRESLARLNQAMRGGQVKTLLILGGNPVFDAPADYAFAQQLERVEFKAHLTLETNETTRRCDYELPAAHPLETWGDGRALDGTVSLQQPLIAPLYGGKTASELIALVIGSAERDGHALLKGYWARELAQQRGHGQSFDFESTWEKSLESGMIAQTALPLQAPALKISSERLKVRDPSPAVPPLEVCFRADAALYDGRFANNGWLQELPRPLSQLTWDNAAWISPDTAQRWGVSNGDVITLRSGSRSVRIPVWRMPGQADDSITLALGNGRRDVGRVGQHAGFNVYPLRASDALGFLTDVQIETTGRRYELVTTQQHHEMEGRELVRQFSQFSQFSQFKDAAISTGLTVPTSLLPVANPDETPGAYRWGMVIDLNVCTGCNACVIACQAENNVPVVGREQVRRGREMHWIRVSRYFEGPPQAPKIHFQPVPCMHCEKAPCELVCPVGATVHDEEGLNEMVYNRCVGTRYCSNNCPYKVRRFNFFQYQDTRTPVVQLSRNPEVTVRSRGVMEKCTYCVQRISAAKIKTQIESRRIEDADLQSACAQACPTEAIVFGDIGNPRSEVARLRGERQHYALLEELGTRPRTTYLGKIINPATEGP